MREIYLTGKHGKDKFVLVDDEDYEELSKYNWYCDKYGYAIRERLVVESKEYPKHILMHRQIMKVVGLCKDIQIDHIDGNRKNNLKRNLRICTNKENSYNSKYGYGSSKFKGVHKHKKGKFVSQISLNGNNYYIGYFDDEIIAAKAYDQVAGVLHGKFAKLNFPEINENIIDINKFLKKKGKN